MNTYHSALKGGKILISKLISFFKGYLEITAQGYFLERFLNLCLMEDILLYDLSHKDTETLSAKINISSFVKLRNIARKTRTKIKIYESEIKIAKLKFI